MEIQLTQCGEEFLQLRWDVMVVLQVQPASQNPSDQKNDTECSSLDKLFEYVVKQGLQLFN